MNVFIIPSWYPSDTTAVAGIFFKEQAYYLAELNKNINIGICLWGQNDNNLIFSRHNFQRPDKVIRYYLNQTPNSRLIKENLQEFYCPAISWSNKAFNGNISGIFKAVLANKCAFEKEFGPIDIVHAHVSYPAGYLAKKLKKIFKIPYVLTEHMSPFPFDNLLIKGQPIAAIKEAFDSADQVIAVSTSLAQTIKQYQLPEARVIPNVIDEDFFIGKDKNEPAQKFVFFTLCGMVPQKGIPDLIKAIQLVTKKIQKVEFRIGGDGPWLKEFQELGLTLGVSKYIVWLGALSRDQARQEYSRANAFVLPSKHETFGVVFGEALACGIPIIATDCGGPRDIVNPQIGMLVEVGDVEVLALQMEKMVLKLSDYKPLEIRKYFESKYSKRIVIDQLVQVYLSVLNH